VSEVQRLREYVQAGSVAVVTGALLVGAVQAGNAVQPAAGAAPAAPAAPVSLADDTLSAFPADEMGAAAAEAKQIEVQRAKREAQRAQRSSGPMYTPTANYTYSARFGQPGGWSSGYHTGLDFAAPTGTPVFSALAGTVGQAGYDGAYGNRIIVKHDGVKTLYAHLSATSVGAGDKVLRGERIGAVGSTGNSTGPHLHFEVIKSGTQRDPSAFL
jgi:murein DD-endopeptidase MepM/ murein hydrolase activator NlpD